MGKHRNADLLLADAMKEVERLQIKAQQEQIASNPAMIALQKEKSALTRDVIKLNRQMGVSDPDKGWAATIVRLKNQITDLETSIENGEDALATVKNRIVAVNAEINEVAAELVN